MITSDIPVVNFPIPFEIEWVNVEDKDHPLAQHVPSGQSISSPYSKLSSNIEKSITIESCTATCSRCRVVCLIMIPYSPISTLIDA